MQRPSITTLNDGSERRRIIRMPTFRPQQRYDHRLRDLVQRAGDLSIARLTVSRARRHVGGSARRRDTTRLSATKALTIDDLGASRGSASTAVNRGRWTYWEELCHTSALRAPPCEQWWRCRPVVASLPCARITRMDRRFGRRGKGSGPLRFQVSQQSTARSRRDRVFGRDRSVRSKNRI
jgi:hypothetical protein